MSLTFYTLTSLARALLEPMSLVVLILIGIIFYKKNKKITIMQKMVVGESLNSPLELTISEIVIGLMGSLIASCLIGFFDISFNENSMIDLMFLISIVFMFLKPRFICFSYSGALIGFLSLVFKEMSIILNDPTLDIFKIDIVSIMSLVAILHFVEGIMIIIDGNRSSIPVFSKKKDKIYGGFVLKRYWILPISLLFVINSLKLSGSVTSQLYNWWPLAKEGIVPFSIGSVLITSMTVYGAIGYEAITFTRTREKKVISSGLGVMIYSIILFSICTLFKGGLLQDIILIVFAPIGHEAMIFLQKYIESKNRFIYESTDEGIMVLEVAPNSLAYTIGVRSGDLLIDINNKKIENEKDIVEVIKDAPNYVKLIAKRISGDLKEFHYDNLISRADFGAVFVPKSIPKGKEIIPIKEDNFKKVLDIAKEKHRNY
ncbi:PDZ domain-containing protein [Haloimpatiens sp. FM7315]|uniref:PDZ domain-containing protein n=1 Tax=Haloimpatiens sp. FM7315 TaxID=3298609 RepID=UPI00370B30EF